VAGREAAGLGRAPLVAIAVFATGAALGLTLFFFAAKHRLPLARVLPFGEDPYDAVGSFGFQLALATAAISFLRAVRRYGGSGVPAAQAALVLRGCVATLLAVFVTMQADAVALLRHPRVWMRSPLGSTLAIGLLVVALASVSGAALLGPVAHRTQPESRPSWGRGAAFAAAGTLVLALYPEAWRRGLVGAIGTVLAGMAVLFAETWGLLVAIAPQGEAPSDDLLDDLHGLLGGQTGGPGRWLRAKPGRFAALVAVAGGAGLAASQAMGEGLPGGAGRALLVLGVYTGLEALAVVLGYTLFRRPLALIRERDRA
jgi:hypothetical protein